MPFDAGFFCDAYVLIRLMFFFCVCVLHSETNVNSRCNLIRLEFQNTVSFIDTHGVAAKYIHPNAIKLNLVQMAHTWNNVP